MPSISMPKYIKLFHRIFLPIFCLMQYAVSFLMVLIAISPEDAPVGRAFALVWITIAAFYMPYWFKTFAYRDAIGFDFVLAVEWTWDEVTFEGAFFRFTIPVQDVLQYKTHFGNPDSPYSRTILKLRTPRGWVERATLFGNMQGIKQFLDFLNERKLRDYQPLT